MLLLLLHLLVILRSWQHNLRAEERAGDVVAGLVQALLNLIKVRVHAVAQHIADVQVLHIVQQAAQQALGHGLLRGRVARAWVMQVTTALENVRAQV